MKISLAVLVAASMFAFVPAYADEARPWTVNMTAPLLVDGKTIKDQTTHDPADWVEIKDGPRRGQYDDLDPKCLKCQDMTIGAAVHMVLTSIRRDERPMPEMPIQEGWKAWADKIINDKAVKLSPGQMKLIEDRVDKIIIVPAVATAIKKAIDPNYEPELPK